MKIDRIITSCDYRYMEFWPTFARACHVFLNMRPLLVYVDNGPSDFVVDETYGDVVRIPFYEHLPRRLQGKAGRIWYNQFLTNETTLIADVDLPMFSLDWMNDGIKDIPNDTFIGAVLTNNTSAVKDTVFGGKRWLSMCYATGSPEVITSIFRLNDSFEDYVNSVFEATRVHHPELLLDEPLLNYNGNIGKFAEVKKPGITRGMHRFRLDLPMRDTWSNEQLLTCIDAHGRDPVRLEQIVNEVIKVRGL